METNVNDLIYSKNFVLMRKCLIYALSQLFKASKNSISYLNEMVSTYRIGTIIYTKESENTKNCFKISILYKSYENQ